MIGLIFSLVMLPFMAIGFAFEIARIGFGAGRDAADDAMNFIISRRKKSMTAEKAKP